VFITVAHPDISPDATTISTLLSESFTPIIRLGQGEKIAIAPFKSSVTLFTPWTSQITGEPEISINYIPVTTNNKPKILEVTFNHLFTFTPNSYLGIRPPPSPASTHRHILRLGKGEYSTHM